MVKTLVDLVEEVAGMLRRSPTWAGVIREGLDRDTVVSTTVVCETETAMVTRSLPVFALRWRRSPLFVARFGWGSEKTLIIADPPIAQ